VAKIFVPSGTFRGLIDVYITNTTTTTTTTTAAAAAFTQVLQS
jgi:hypothetical protein